MTMLHQHIKIDQNMRSSLVFLQLLKLLWIAQISATERRHTFSQQLHKRAVHRAQSLLEMWHPSFVCLLVAYEGANRSIEFYTLLT